MSKVLAPVSGPTSSGSFALSLIRGAPQRAIHGPVRLARRPAEHPPDQRQDSAVTNVAICVVSAIVTKKRFYVCSDYGQGMTLRCNTDVMRGVTKDIHTQSVDLSFPRSAW